MRPIENDRPGFMLTDGHHRNLWHWATGGNRCICRAYGDVESEREFFILLLSPWSSPSSDETSQCHAVDVTSSLAGSRITILKEMKKTSTFTSWFLLIVNRSPWNATHFFLSATKLSKDHPTGRECFVQMTCSLWRHDLFILWGPELIVDIIRLTRPVQWPSNAKNSPAAMLPIRGDGLRSFNETQTHRKLYILTSAWRSEWTLDRKFTNGQLKEGACYFCYLGRLLSICSWMPDPADSDPKDLGQSNSTATECHQNKWKSPPNKERYFHLKLQFDIIFANLVIRFTG